MTVRVEHIGDATRWVRIYALCEYPDTPRYVGKTIQWLGDRHKAHIRSAKRGMCLPVHYWLRKQIAGGKWLTIKLLENVADDADWITRERFWIAKLRCEGAKLLNLTDGGEGLSGHRFSDDHRAKIAAALRTGGTFTCLVCGKSFWRKLRDINMKHNKFCSRYCSNKRRKGRGLFDER